MSIEVHDFLSLAVSIDPSFANAAGRARAKIDSFASGKVVVMALDPATKSPATLVARNAPVSRGVVDLRVTSFKPDARIFGGFAAPDVLVLLTWAPKTGLHYRTEINRCRQTWDQFFPNNSPIVGNAHEHYITSNVIPG